jgi:transglutaminase-like putative cysteine protease
VEEFLLETMISLGEAIPRGARATTFHMQSIQGPWDGELHQGPLQQVKKINEKVVEVLVQSEELVKGEVLPREKRREYLAPNLYLDSDDLLIQNLAKEAIGQENEPIKIAGLLSSFVHRYINSKNFAVGFASASEVARKRAGDCTEHSVLLAALGRACQIPSRVVTGLVYAPRFEGKRHVLVYHMWTQFYLQGKWVNYDSALGYKKCPADRITFSVSSLAGEDLTESMIPVMNLIKNITVSLK